MAQFPDVGIKSMSMRLRNAVSMSMSPFTYDQQVYEHQGVIWEAEISLPPLERNEAKAVEGFLAGLRGQSNTFTLGNPLHNSAATGTLTGSVGDTTVTASMSGHAVGDYFEHDDHLYIITSIDGASVGIMPPLRTSASSSTADFTYPQGTWRLASNEVNWAIDTAGFYSITLAIVEAI
jgi:hypothetical protein